MRKSKFNLFCMMLGIFAAMLLLAMPSVVMAVGGFEGLGSLCEDTQFVTFEMSGGPPFIGTINVKYEPFDSGVYVSGSISSQGNDSCKITFRDDMLPPGPWALYLDGVTSADWNDIKDGNGGAMRGLRLGTDSAQLLEPDLCVYNVSDAGCFQIIGVGHFNLLDPNQFSALFILMPLN